MTHKSIRTKKKSLLNLNMETRIRTMDQTNKLETTMVYSTGRSSRNLMNKCLMQTQLLTIQKTSIESIEPKLLATSEGMQMIRFQSCDYLSEEIPATITNSLIAN